MGDGRAVWQPVRPRRLARGLRPREWRQGARLQWRLSLVRYRSARIRAHRCRRARLPRFARQCRNRAGGARPACLPVLQSFSRDRVLINSGAAGMPNFRGELFGLATRIAVSSSTEALYRLRCGELFVEAVPLRYDAEAWERSFLRQWPAGSDAHVSYHRRMTHGPQYSRAQALRATPRFLAARP